MDCSTIKPKDKCLYFIFYEKKIFVDVAVNNPLPMMYWQLFNVSS